MSESHQTQETASHQSTTSRPRAVIHKRILDTADEHPTAGVEDLAGMIPGATANLINRVLEEYGDPGATTSDDTITMNQEDTTETSAAVDGGTTPDTPTAETTPNDDTGAAPSTDGSLTSASTSSEDGDDEQSEATVDPTPPSLDSLSEAQRSVLEAIRDRPHATQRELADEFDVSRATISQRVNAIEGFEWRNRQSFVQQLFSTMGDSTASNTSTPDESPLADEMATLQDQLDILTEEIERLTERVATLEERVGETPLEDPDLRSRMIHACLHADELSEEEELRIIRAYLS